MSILLKMGYKYVIAWKRQNGESACKWMIFQTMPAADGIIDNNNRSLLFLTHQIHQKEPKRKKGKWKKKQDSVQISWEDVFATSDWKAPTAVLRTPTCDILYGHPKRYVCLLADQVKDYGKGTNCLNLL